MSDLEQFAQWLVKNQDKRGTQEFETVANAFRSLDSGYRAPAPAAPDTSRTALESVTDIGAAALQGLGQFAQFPGQLTKLIPGLYGVGEAIEKPGESLAELGESLKSKGLLAREALRSKALSAAEKEGVISEFATAVGQTIKDPALLTTFIAQQLPQLIGPAAAAKVAAKTATRGLAAEAAAEAAQKSAYRAAVGTGATMQGADIASDVLQEGIAIAKQQNPGISDEQALDIAINKARLAGLGAGLTSLLTQRLPGAQAIERRMAGLPGAGRLTGAAGEALSEAAEEGGGAFLKNLALQQIDPTRELLAGVGSAAGLGALGGGALGAILSQGKAPEAEPLGELQDRARMLKQQLEELRQTEQASTLPTDKQLFTLAAQPNGYGLLENLKQRVLQDTSFPEADRNAAAENIAKIQDRIRLEDAQRRESFTRISEQDLIQAGIGQKDPLFALAGQDFASDNNVFDQINQTLSGEITDEQRKKYEGLYEGLSQLRQDLYPEGQDAGIPQMVTPPVEAPAAAPQIKTADELSDMAERGAYGEIEQYAQGLKQFPQTAEVKQAFDDAKAVQRRMNIERASEFNIPALFEGKDLNKQEDVDAIAKSLYDELKKKDLTPERERRIRTALDVFVNALPEDVQAPPMPDWAVEIPEKRRVPKSEEAKAEAAFRADIEKQIRAAKAEANAVARGGKSLFETLKGKLNPKEVFDISPDKRVAPLKRKSGGLDLDYFVDSGLLDEFLPPHMRHNAAQFNSTESQELIKDLIRQGVYTTFDVRIKAEQTKNAIEEMEKVLMEFNTDELNALLQEAADEQRAEERVLEEVPATAPEAEGRVAEERVEAPREEEVKAEEKVEEKAVEEKPEEKAKPAEETVKATRNNPIAVLEEEGFERVPKGSPERYRDTEGTEYFTMQRGPVRVAMKTNEALTIGERNLVLRASEPGNLTISALLVDPEARGEGHARRAMEAITKAADEFGVDLYIEPAPISDKPMSQAQLTKFYTSLGFTPLPNSGGRVMVRVAEAPKAEAPKALAKPEGEVIDVEARVVEETLGPKVNALPAPQIATLEKHYGVKKDSPTFLQRIKEDVVLYATKGGKAVAAIIRPIIRNLHAAVLSVATIFNPANISPAEAVIFDKQVITETKDIRVAPPESVASKMSPGAREAYSILYPSIKEQLQRDNKLMLIVDKPRARMFVFTPDGQPLLDKKVLLGAATGDLYKGNNNLPQNRITPAGLFKMGLRDADRSIGEAKTAGEYDFKKVFVLDKAIEGEYSVTLFHSVWLKESDAQMRAKALKSESETDSRYSFGCINVDKQTYERLITDHLNQMDGASLFIVPDNQAATAEFLTGATAKNVSGADGLTRTTFTPAKETVAYEVKRAGRPGELMREVSKTPVKKSLAAVTKEVPAGKFAELQRRAEEARTKTEEPTAESEEQQARALAEKELIAELDKTLKRILAKFGLKDIDFSLEDGLTDEGSFEGRLIRLALDVNDPVRVLRHESIHALKELGFFSDSQWKSLVKRAESEWIQTHLKDREHKPGQSRYDAYVEMFKAEGKTDAEIQEALAEEAIADAFGIFEKETPPPGMMAAILRRMNNLFKAIKQAFNLNGIESAEEIFGKVEKGELKPAVPMGKVKEEAKASLRILETDSFKKWFGDSKLVDKDGKPLVLYHGTYRDFNEFKPGSYVTSDPEYASQFGDRVLPVYVSASKIRIILDEDFRMLAGDERKIQSYIDQGLDALASDNGDAWIVLKPEKIKSSIGNVGTYDITSRDIRKSLRAPQTEAFKRWFGDSKVVEPFDPKLVREGREYESRLFGGAYSASRVSGPRALKGSPAYRMALAGRDRYNEIRRELGMEEVSDWSKAPDELVDRFKGNPLVVYHGTTADIDVFAISPKANRSGNPDGYYFTPDPEEADQYTRGKPDANIMPVFLKIENPFVQGSVVSQRMIGEFEKELRKANPNLGQSWINEKVSIFKDRSRSKTKWFPEIFPNITFPTDAMTRILKAGGYDGFKDGSHWIAINPNQIKSATGNIGTYEPTSPDIRKSLRSIASLTPQEAQRLNTVTVPRREAGFKERIMETISPRSFSYFRQKAINRVNVLAEQDKYVAKQIKLMGGAEQLADAKAETAALQSDLAAGVTASAMGVHDRVGGTPVYVKHYVVEKDFRVIGPKYPTRRAAELAASKIPGASVFERGYTTVTNKNNSVKGLIAIFAPLAKYGDPKVYQHYQLWAMAKRGKRLDAEGREKTLEAPDYALAKKFDAQYNQNGEWDKIQAEWIKYNDGLVDYMVDTGVISAERGKIFKAHGDYFPFYRQLEEEDALGPKVFQSPSRVQGPKALKGSEAPVGDFFENLVRNTQSAIQAGMKNVAGRRATDQALRIGEVTKLPGPPAKQTADIYRVLEDGKEVYYRSNDPLFIDAIKSLNLGDLPFIGLLSAPANVLRNLVTKDPAFMLANMMRDSLSAYTTSGVKMTPIAATLANFGKAIAGQSPELTALLNAGVIGGYDYSQGVQTSAKRLEKEVRKAAGMRTAMEKITSPVTSLWDALEKGTQASDAATRMEVYKKVLAETGNEAEALWQALEVMNFNRKGNSPIVRVLTAAVPFLNARIQGLDLLYRVGFRPMIDENATDEQKARMRSFWVRGMTMMALSSMYWLMTHDDDDYKKQEQETRDNYWLIPSMGVKIPIPFEVGVLFKVVPERILELSYGQDTGKDTWDSVKRNVLSTFAFNPIPQTALPIVEAVTNHSFFTGRAIVAPGMEEVAPEFQVSAGTSRFAELLGKNLGLSPIKIDHVIKGYTGTIGGYAADVFDMVYDLNADVPKASKRMEQMPVIRRFLVDPEARGTVTAYYDLKNSVDEVVRTSNYLERTMNYEDYGKYMQENINVLATKEYILDMEKTMKEFRDTRVLIQNSQMDADAKRDALKAINQAENQITSNIRTIKKAIQ